jgi:hypothetical protein
MTLPTLPVLRQGKPYESLDKAELKSVRSGETVAMINQANAAMIRRDMRRANRDALKAIPSDTLMAMCAEAGKLFMEGTLPLGDGTQTPEDYVQQLAASSGLPHVLIRRNMQKIYTVFAEMPTILRGLTRGLELSVLDKGYGEQAGVPVSYYPMTNALGIVLPSNSPGVNSLWIPAIALKIPVVLKPGREEPWTPFRIIQAFIAAGIPAEAFSFYPTDHEGSSAVMDVCNRAIIFGDQSTVERYAANPNVEVHGPGWSKVLIGEDKIENWREYIDVIAASVADNGGRSCINASAVIVPSHGAEIADALAQKLAALRPLPADDPNAGLAGFANPKMAEFIDGAIAEGLQTAGATDVTAKYRTGERKVEQDGSTYLLPTVVHCDSFTHPLGNKEFLFPYASVVEMPQADMMEKIGPSLVVTAITDDPKFTEHLLESPHIERLNLGALPTSHVKWDQPHEGNLFEFLYRRRAIQRA